MNGYRHVLLGALLVGSAVCHAQKAPIESDFYTIREVPIPENVFLEVGALEELDGKLYASSRRGDIYAIEGAFEKDVSQAKFQLFASGLHEVLGLSKLGDHLYATQRGEITVLADVDDDGRADLFQTVTDGWGINGDYHEYAFGSKFDSHNEMWVVLCLTGSFTSENLYRGWCLRVRPDGTVIPTCSGIRSPGGIGSNAAGDMFYTDNQGPWNGTCGLKWLRPGSFQGNPTGNQHYAATNAIGPRPKDPESGSRIMKEAEQIPELEPTAVMFPYNTMGKSASGVVCDMSNGKFGPFAKQMFVADQSASTVMRVFLEKVKGHYQGACFPFRKGFGSGALALLVSSDGSMFVGGTNRGWGSVGTKPFALERLNWTGRVPFEILEMRVCPDGFEIEFTQPVDPATLTDVGAYSIKTYTYIYQSSYGSPEVDHSEPTIEKADLVDAKTVRLRIDGLQIGHVHELHVNGVRSAQDSFPVLHPVAYYTLNFLPERQ